MLPLIRTYREKIRDMADDSRCRLGVVSVQVEKKDGKRFFPDIRREQNVTKEANLASTARKSSLVNQMASMGTNVCSTR